MYMNMNRIEQLEIENKQSKEEWDLAKKNNNFVQLYRDNMPELRWLMKKNGIASGILFFIIEHMDNKNALACSYEVFEEYFEISRTTTYRAIKLLKDNGFIDVLKMGNSNIYIINTEIAWTSWNNKKEFVKFEGNILISRKENKDYEYRSQFDKFKALRAKENIK